MINRRQIRDTLVAAKSHVATKANQPGKLQYICWAFDRSVSLGEIPYMAKFDAREMIHERLGNYYCIEEWLEANVGRTKVRKAGKTAVQEYRHRWLDAMIKEFSK